MSEAQATLSGEWTIHAIAQQHEALKPVLDAGQHVLDASGITDMDTAGLQLLLAASHSLARQGLAMQIVAPSDSVKAVLQGWCLDAELQPLNH